MYIHEQTLRGLCGEPAYRAGLRLYKAGCVQETRRCGGVARACVRGRAVNRVEITFARDALKPLDAYKCDCAKEGVCSHVMAALFAFNNSDDAGEPAGRLIEALTMPEPRVGLLSEVSIVKDADAFHAYLKLGTGAPLDAIVDFPALLEAYKSSKPARVAAFFEFDPAIHSLEPHICKLLQIFTELFENAQLSSYYYWGDKNGVSFGEHTAARVFEALSGVKFRLRLKRGSYRGVRVTGGNPPARLSVIREDGGLRIALSHEIIPLLDDYSFVISDGVLFHTGREWREPFRLLARSLNRGELFIPAADAGNFILSALPKIRGFMDVDERGAMDGVICEAPVFSVHLDVCGADVCALVKAQYGDYELDLAANAEDAAFVARDFQAEGRVLGALNATARADGLFHIMGDASIYDFISRGLDRLKEVARVYHSDSFEQIKIIKNDAPHCTIDYDGGELLIDFDSRLLEQSDFEGLLNAAAGKKPFFRMKDGGFLELDEQSLGGLRRLLDGLRLAPGGLVERRVVLPKNRMFYLNSVLQSAAGRSARFEALLESFSQLPHTYDGRLFDTLRTYQRTGIDWLRALARMGFGGILADDMGLGKTLQVIAFVEHERAAHPSLVVSPSALLYNWQSEIMKFAPHMKCIIMDGSAAVRSALACELDNYDFVITSYALLRRDIEFYTEKTFSYCFIDEAQHIKNHNTLNARSVKRLNAGCRFALTGTPVENSLAELWSIFDFIMPGYLYSYADFAKRFETPITKLGDSAAKQDLKRHISPFMLRRVKKDVLTELPEKIETTMPAELLPGQRALYDSYAATARREAQTQLEDGGRDSIKILTLLLRLRQLCCYPGLFLDSGEPSGKLELLKELVEDAVSAGHRILIFSQFTTMLSVIRDELECMAIETLYLDGATPPKERAGLATEFNHGKGAVFLISLKAGGVGLNLTGADMVIHFDPWWNSAAEDQASDRAYRIGQNRAVHVIKLVSKGTIEEKIVRLQSQKKRLANDVVDVNETPLAAMSPAEIVSLFD